MVTVPIFLPIFLFIPIFIFPPKNYRRYWEPHRYMQSR